MIVWWLTIRINIFLTVAQLKATGSFQRNAQTNYSPFIKMKYKQDIKTYI